MGRAQIDMVRIIQTWRSFDRPKIPVIQLASASLATGLAINYELSSFQEAGYTSTESLPAFSAWAKLANSFLLHVAVSEVYALKMRSRVFLFFVLLVCQSSWAQEPEYDFYPEFRNVFAPKFYVAHPASSSKDVVAAYVVDLKAQGIDSREIRPRFTKAWWNGRYGSGSRLRGTKRYVENVRCLANQAIRDRPREGGLSRPTGNRHCPSRCR